MTITQTTLSPLTSSALDHPVLRHAFFTRAGGVSEGIYRGLNGGLGSHDNPAHIAENRRRMASYFDRDAGDLLSLYQIHSSDVVIVDQAWSVEDRPRADAMVTNTAGVVLAIGTADCGPVLFADPDALVIGAAHAGWKGALTGILEATINAMESLGANRHRIAACVGPMISQASYEVDAVFRDRFLDQAADHAQFFGSGVRDGKFQFDLPAYIRNRLTQAGLTRVDDLALCTYQDDERFYSFRRTTHRGEPDYGRLISAISLHPQ